MNALEVVKKCMAGLKPFEIRLVLNKMYRESMLDYNEYWEGIEITMEMQEETK